MRWGGDRAPAETLESYEDEDEDAPAEASVTSEAHALALVCPTGKTAHEYGDDAFLTEAQRTVEDVCLVLSLLAGGTITWHGYFQSEDRAFAPLQPQPGPRRGRGTIEEIVQSSQFRDFVRGHSADCNGCGQTGCSSKCRSSWRSRSAGTRAAALFWRVLPRAGGAAQHRA
jgi:hypothetical protein